MAEVKDLQDAQKRRQQEEEDARNGNGGAPEGPDKSLEQLADEEPIDDGEGQTLLDFGDHMTLSVKGKKPTDSQVKIKAISRDIRGQLGDKGDDEYVTVLVRCRQDEISFVSKRDGDDKVTSKIRRHTLTPISVMPLNEATVGKIEQILDDDE